MNLMKLSLIVLSVTISAGIISCKSVHSFGPLTDSTGKKLMDVHGAGAQRNNPKTGDPSRFSLGHGPQGDIVTINNFVRCVRVAEKPANYPVVDTGQTDTYGTDRTGKLRRDPNPGEPLYGQDAQYAGAAPTYTDNGDGTVTDKATGLMWMKQDSGHLNAGKNRDGKLNWKEALAWAENIDHAGYSDWKLPNAKELHSIVDYSRSPDTTHSAAIAPLFLTSSIIDGSGNTDYPFFWTSTTHLDGRYPGEYAVYFAFGEAEGYMGRPGGRSGRMRPGPRDLN